MNRSKLENKIINGVKKKNGGTVPDERQQLFSSMISTTALVFGIAFDLIMMIYYFFTKNIEKAYPYVAQLVIMSIGCLIASIGNKEAQPPTVFFGKHILNTDKSFSAFLSRVFWCMLDSLVFIAIIAVCNAYIDGKVTGSSILDGIIILCILTVIESIFCEIKVHRYRKHIAMLDAEENDLED